MLFNDEFVFLHYPRSAGKSLTRYMIEAWQGPIHGLVSLRQTKELEDVMRPDVFLEAVGAHQTVSQAKAILAERGKRIEEFRAVFVGIRDPYDMAVSRYCFMRRTYQWNQDRPTFQKAHELEFEDFWLSYRANLGDAFLTIDGAVLDNQRFIRFETLQEDLEDISVGVRLQPRQPLSPQQHASRPLFELREDTPVRTGDIREISLPVRYRAVSPKAGVLNRRGCKAHRSVGASPSPEPPA